MIARPQGELSQVPFPKVVTEIVGRPGRRILERVGRPRAMEAPTSSKQTVHRISAQSVSDVI